MCMARVVRLGEVLDGWGVVLGDVVDGLNGVSVAVFIRLAD